jgi:type 1 glutamine amidotransferase
VGSSRVFYTSLGHPGDFDNAAFCRMLRNAVFWAMNRQPSGGPSSISISTSRSRFKITGADFDGNAFSHGNRVFSW